MNIEHINNIIKKPETLNYTEDLPLVKELIESFPYFAPGYAMLTKMLHAQNSVYLDKYLHLTAAYIGDREVLYNYLYPPAKEENSIHYIKAGAEQAPELERRAEATTLLSSLPEEALPVPEIIEKQLIEETLAIDIEAPPLHIDIEESHAEAADHLQPDENVPETEHRALLSHLPDGALQTPENVKRVTNAPEPETESIEEKAFTENIIENEFKPSPEEFIPSETIEEKPVILPPSPKLELNITPLAAYDYFSAMGKPDVEEVHEPFHLKPVPAYNEGVEDGQAIDSEPHSFQEWLEKLGHKKLAAKAKTELIIDKVNLPAQDKTQIDAIISSFIRKEPKIRPPQTKFFKPEDMAQQSAIEDYTLVTETLANIYLRQELYAKATEAFRRLIDKHPDKREYFENKIEEVEKAKKENKGAS